MFPHAFSEVESAIVLFKLQTRLRLVGTTNSPPGLGSVWSVTFWSQGQKLHPQKILMPSFSELAIYKTTCSLEHLPRMTISHLFLILVTLFPSSLCLRSPNSCSIYVTNPWPLARWIWGIFSVSLLEWLENKPFLCYKSPVSQSLTSCCGRLVLISVNSCSNCDPSWVWSKRRKSNFSSVDGTLPWVLTCSRDRCRSWSCSSCCQILCTKSCSLLDPARKISFEGVLLWVWC